MKATLNRACGAVFLVVLGLQAVGCSSAQQSSKEIVGVGPTILNARAEPDKTELGKGLRATKTTRVFADVKDFSSRLVDVRLNFVQVPLSIPMKNIEGTTWVAELTPAQLEDLAVSGKTMTYEAQIFAKDEGGHISNTKSPVEIKIQAPQIAMND